MQINILRNTFTLLISQNLIFSFDVGIRQNQEFREVGQGMVTT